MIGNLYPALTISESQFVVSPGFTGGGLVRSTSVTTEQNNDIRWLAAGN